MEGEVMLNNSREYRLHVTADGCFYACRKMLKADAEERWYKNDSNCVVSPIYELFFCSDKKLMSEYLYLWVKRNEFFRYTGFHSIASVRNNFDYNLITELCIPIPEIKIQQSVVDIFLTYKKRKEISENLKKRINDMCPILIKGSLI
jgi:type I restriction enzyme S subunit